MAPTGLCNRWRALAVIVGSQLLVWSVTRLAQFSYKEMAISQARYPLAKPAYEYMRRDHIVSKTSPKQSDSSAANASITQLLVHARIDGGLTNMMWGLGKSLVIAQMLGARMAEPCIKRDYLNVTLPRDPMEVLFDVHYFRAKAKELYGVEVVPEASQCGEWRYDKYVQRLPNVLPTDPALAELFETRDAKAILARGREIALNTPLLMKVPWQMIRRDKLYEALRPAPRLQAIIEQALEALQSDVMETREGGGGFAGWCQLNEGSVVGIHLRTEPDMTTHCTAKGVPLEVCAPTTEQVAGILCEHMGLPCRGLTAFVASGSPRESYIDPLRGVFARVVDKIELVPGLLDMGLLREESAYIDQELLRSTSLFVGNAGSSLTQSIVGRRMASDAMPTTLTYASPSVGKVAVCLEENIQFFTKRNCTPDTTCGRTHFK